MENYLKLDWLGFTFKPDIKLAGTPIEQFLSMFPEIDSSEFVVPTFGSHYNHTVWFNDIVIAYNEIGEDCTPTEFDAYYRMGVNVQVASHCLSFFCNLFGIDFRSEYSVRDLLKLIQDRKCIFSRIDVCYDDFEKHYNTKYYIDKYFNRCIASPCHTVTCFVSNCEVDKGSTLYFGSLKRRKKLLRIYDKYAESNGEVDSVRYEFEFHSDCCKDLVNKIFEFDGKLPFLDMLLSVCRVVDSNSKIHDLSDRETDAEWLSALKCNLTLCSPLKIRASRLTDHDNPDDYVLCQVMPSIAGYIKKNGIVSLFEVAKKFMRAGRISPKYQNYFNKLKHCDDLFPVDNTFVDDDPDDNPFI